jgi:hypothetical protein
MWFWFDCTHLLVQMLLNVLAHYGCPLIADNLLMAFRSMVEHQGLKIAEDGSVVLSSFYA